MAISCDPNDLASAAACFNQGYGAPLLKAMRIRLLCAFLNSETMTCTPDALAELVSCFLALDAGTIDAIETYLVCQVANAGGGGSGCVTCSSTPPTDPPNEADCPCAITVGIGDWVGFYWVWDVGFTDTWVQVPGGP